MSTWRWQLSDQIRCPSLGCQSHVLSCLITNNIKFLNIQFSQFSQQQSNSLAASSEWLMPKIPKSTPEHNPNPLPEIHPEVLLQQSSRCSKDTCYEVPRFKCIFSPSLSCTSCTVLTSTISYPPAIVEDKCKSSRSSVCTFSQCSLPLHLLSSK
jgi:hypothetical protein